ncbi:hypothetical protein RRG08_051867 [Elysia crispata]|uniref:Uncharacterized protein n=1 Tax=Elysia crispata TaxID=231223 RepID=A0AAE0Z9I7_9GAST|nr:hypothetical protein RRG08_051867 [Elysia crispata]
MVGSLTSLSAFLNISVKELVSQIEILRSRLYSSQCWDLNSWVMQGRQIDNKQSTELLTTQTGDTNPTGRQLNKKNQHLYNSDLAVSQNPLLGPSAHDSAVSACFRCIPGHRSGQGRPDKPDKPADKTRAVC